ncbi:hypothetical protein D3C81_1781880 [compost metagenome]
MFRDAADFILSGCFLNRITPLFSASPFHLIMGNRAKRMRPIPQEGREIQAVLPLVEDGLVKPPNTGNICLPLGIK